jgi:precorrin-6A/cobalt-precorrin-6A reductase
MAALPQVFQAACWHARQKRVIPGQTRGNHRQEKAGQQVTGKVAIIAGSVEAFFLAQALPEALVWLPMPERVPRAWADVPQVGPVTPAALKRAGVKVVIEAGHPCDDRQAWAIARAARAAGLPCLQLVRPAWRATRADRWTMLRSLAEARGLPQTARVLITLGRAELTGLKGWRGQALVRRIGPAPETFPLLCGRFIRGQGPFSIAQEIQLMRKERIDWLLVRNAGGQGGWPKLAAARALGLPVAMVARPARPPGPRARSVKEALAWLDRQNG